MSQTVIIKTDKSVSNESPTPAVPQESEGGTAATSSPESPPQVAEAKGTFAEAISAGHGLYMKRDYQSALSRYEEAKQLKPDNALIYYFIGCAQAKLQRYDEALVTLKTTTNIAGTKELDTHGKALFMMALVEEMRHRDEAAMEAWKSYKVFAQTYTDAVTYSATATERLKVLELKRSMEEQYVAVRERIANSQ
jgi:tetratricopeptide (TPR) repeat protein